MKYNPTRYSSAVGEIWVMATFLFLTIGYLAMVADFIPFVTTGRKYLTLKEFLGPLQEKIAAKHI